MGYHGDMGYELNFSAYQVGNKKYLWGKREYEILELWVKRASTGKMSGNAASVNTSEVTSGMGKLRGHSTRVAQRQRRGIKNTH